MHENESQATLIALGSRGSKRGSGMAPTPQRNASTTTFSPSGPPPAGNTLSRSAEARLAKSLMEAGRDGADRLRARKDIDLSAPITSDFYPKSAYGTLVSRVISRRCDAAGLSVGAVMAAAGKTAFATGGGGLASGGATGTAATSLATTPLGGPTPATFDPVMVMLVNRLTGAFDNDEYQLAVSLGFNGYLSHHLNHTSIPDPAPAAFLAGDQTVTPTGNPNTGYFANVAEDNAEVLATTPSGLDGLWAVLLQATTIYRSILTKRMLHDRMTEFWTDHFNIDIKKPLDGTLKPVDDREVIRKFALDKFPAMLTANAHSGAMLIYLDQWLSSYQAPNENYARELLELHTLGEGNGYDEADVVNVAQVLCGWTIQTSGAPGAVGTYGYNASLHHPSPSAYTLLNNHPQKINIVAGGEIQGDQLIAGLGAHPLTATYISTKLLRFLLRYDPTPAQITAVTNSYLTTGGDIKRMIQTILTPANLTALLGTNPSTLKAKRPFQLACTFLRSLKGAPYWTPGMPTNPLQGLTDRLDSLGNAPFYWGPPNGYPDADGAWIGNLLGRWELLDSLAHNEIDGINVDYATLVNLLVPFTVPQTAFRLNEVLAGGAMTSDEQYWIQQFVDIGVILLNLGLVTLDGLMRDIYAVAGSAPSYQYY